MTVKTRIMLFIVGAGFFASLLFSVVVFYEMVEQPFNLLDTVLQEEATRVVRLLVSHPQGSGEEEMSSQTLGLEQYWLEVTDQKKNQVLFRSDLARQVQLAPVPADASAIARPVAVDASVISPWDKSRRPIFRVKTFAINRDGHFFRAQIGRPMEKLNEEIWELFFGILAGLIFSTLILSAISRYVAGKILQPVQQIKDLAKAISEKNLDQRIPVQEEGDELNELAKTINLMLDRLQNSFDRQRGFLFDTSHELKTPLATVRLALDEIFTLDKESVTGQVWDSLLRANNQVFRLERLVKDLLTLSSLEALAGLECHPVDLSTLLNSLVEDYGFLAEDLHIGIKVTIEPHCLVHGAAEKLQRAFVNLFDNALKFNVEGGRISVTCSHQGDTVEVIIANTGTGVAEAALPQVFDQFYRGEKSRATEFGGFGLGLAIVKKTIALHQGHVTFESGLGAITKLTVRLPRLQ
ncbi:MAG: HAMP domain-containing sensor histidine kinase [Desulfobulbus sp.]|nr:HAMP domain-containing sensor histidine kinase [Desulfobulbus sp.]